MANSTVMVNMKFQADTSQAKAKMKELQTSLKSLQTIASADLPLGKTVFGLEQAKNAAAQLQVQLSQAFNQNTGKLDLTKFNQSLKQSNMSLQQYKTILLQAGPAGQQAFGQLAVQIASADTHVIRINQHLVKLGTTLANTFRWQVSSAALMSITSTLSEAYGFAQDLNKSLNEIRIVTGQSAQQMEKFAIQANKSAKALSTTTNEYAKASLIYFQQGLADKDVQKRTDLTIKMANVTSQSVREVSDQLTAIWNNFDDGTKSLEHYVDVMVALGATTASSSEEISEGLNKFAAVAETVGLSYEYAASALATVTATTRQSADVVGTAFKTLFARIQDLELGETLDDGTTLGQYSQALAAIGINIKDVNGDIKDMDIILGEMGARWNTLTKDQQVALAQNVAGVRQYTQLVALMDNWEYFQENLNTSLNSAGALQEQSEIYAESWEAARDRVTAALEDIYQDLLNDDIFIGILNFFADFVENIDSVIESVGGLNGVLTILAAILMKVYSNSLAVSMSSVGATMMSWTKAGQARLKSLREEGFKEATTTYKETNASGRLANENLRNQITAETRYNELTANATETQKAILSIRKESIQKQNEENEKLIEELKTLEQITVELNKQSKTEPYAANQAQYAKQGQIQIATWSSLNAISSQAGAAQIFQQELNYEAYDDRIGAYSSGDYSDDSLNRAKDATQEIITKMEGLRFGADEAEKELKELFGEEVYSALSKYYDKLKETQDTINKLQADPAFKKQAQEENALNEKRAQRIGELSSKQKRNKSENKELAALKRDAKKYEQAHGQLQSAAKETEQAIKNTNDELDVQKKALIKASGGTEEATNKVNQFSTANQQLGQKTAETGVALGKTKSEINSLNNALANSMGPVTFSQKLTTFASMTMSASMALQGFKSLVDAWNNEDISFGDKLIQTMMSLGMIIPAVTTVMNKQNLARLFGVTTMKLESGETIFNTAQKGANTVATWLQKIAQDALNGSILATIAMFAIFAVAVAAVIGVIYLLTKAQEKEKTALEKATEAAKNQQKALESITEAAEEMNDALSEAKDLIASYAEVSDAFDGLIKGSDAYNENLQKEIELINQLLDKYPELLEMGIIGFQDGRYQVLDENMLQQYAIGTATVDKLSMDLAKMYAKEDTEIASEEARYIGEKDEVLKQKKEQRQLTIGAVTGLNFTIRDGAGNQWIIDNSDLPAQRGRAEAINGRRSSVGSTFKAWEERMSKGESFDDLIQNNQSEYNKQLLEAFKGYMNATYDYTNKLSDLDKEHLNNLAEINKKYEQQYKILGSQILSYQKGYADLNQYQQAAASQQVGAQIAANNQKYEFKTGYGVDFNKDLANYILEATNVGGTWSEYNGKDHNDIGDFFVNTVSGTEAIAAYLRDVKGYSDMTRDMLNSDGYTFDSKGMKSGEDSKYQFKLDWAEIAAYYQGQAAYESIDYKAAMEAAAKRSNAANAAIGGTISALSEEDIAAITYGNRENGYTLNTNSKAFREARAAMGTMTEEEQTSWIANLKQQIADYDAALAETLLLQQEMQEGNLILAESAEKYGLNADVVKNYAQSLYDANKAQGMSYTAAVNLAVANGRLAKGLETLRDDWVDISDTLNTASKDSYEWMEAATEAQQALSDMFGVVVSVDFIDKYKEQIGVLVEGGEEAVKVFQELEVAAGKDYIMSLAIDDEYKTEFKSMLEQLTEQETPEMTVGIKGEIDASYIESLNKLLAEGAITADEVNAMFNSIGWDPNITTKPGDPVTNSSMSVITTGESFDPVTGDPMGDGTKSWQKIETTTTPQVPVIGDVTSAPKSSSDIKTTTTSGSSKASKKKSIGRYHEIKEELADLQQELNKISKAKENAFGSNRIAFMEQEIAKQKELIDAEGRYYEQLQTNYQTDLSNLDSRFELDKNGRIQNYTSVLQDLIDQGVSGETYDAIKEAADQYEETLNELEAQQQVVNEETERLKELALEKIEYNVEFKIHLNERDLKQLEHQLKNLDDPIYDAAEALGVMGQMAQKNIDKIAIYRQGIQEVLGQELSQAQLDNFNNLLANMPADGDITAELQDILGVESFSQDQIAALEGYIDSLYDVSDVIDEFYDEIAEKVNAALDKINEKSEKAIDRNEQLGKTLETYSNIIDLVGKKSLGVTEEQIRALGRAQVAQARYNLQLKQSQLEMNQNALADAQAARDAAEKANDADAVKYWDEQIETIQDNVWALESEVESAWADTLQVIADDFTNAVEIATSAFEEAMTNTYGSYDKMQEVFDQQKEIGDRYVEDYQKIYELSKLNRDLNKSIDETDSVKGKQALRDLQKEINALQESDAQMSEYDLEYLRKKYDLRVAEIALEEAQNAKSQVRMQRDAEGNWSYIYTADESKVDSAQQNYEDKLYALQDFAQQHINEMQELVISAEREMVEALNALRAEDFATQEEYQAEVTRITEYYTGMRNYALDELNKTLEHSSEIYETDWNNYSEKTGYKISKEGEWQDKFGETVYAMVTGYNNIEASRSAFAENTEKMIESLTSAFNQWALDVKGAFDDVGKTFDDFAGEEGDLNKKVADVNTELGKINTAFDSWKDSATAAFSALIAAAANNIDGFSEQMAEYKKEIDIITKALTQMINLSGTQLTVPNLPGDTNPGGVTGGGNGGNSGGGGGNNGGNGGNSGGGDGNGGDDDTAPIEYPITVYASRIGQGENAKYEGGFFDFSRQELANATKPYADSKYFQLTKNGYKYDIHQDEYISALREAGWDVYLGGGSDSGPPDNSGPSNRKAVISFDTGGYTGGWGTEGRMAMLHQKEIVLNAHDTENFLSAINIVRDIASMIDLHAAAQQSVLSMMSAGSIAPTTQTLQQEVTIHAEFPNATQRTEIEAAFDTLLNRASQFANRRNK